MTMTPLYILFHDSMANCKSLCVREGKGVRSEPFVKRMLVRGCHYVKRPQGSADKIGKPHRDVTEGVDPHKGL